LPPKGETLLVPNSRTQVLLTWMEVQKRKNAPEPIVTVKPHGVPAALRGFSTEPLVTVKLHGVPRFSGEAPTAPVPKAPVAPAAAPPTKAPVLAPEPPVKDVTVVSPPVLTPATPPVAPTPSDKMMWPVSGKVSSGFGRRGKRHLHAGIDIPMPKGTPIVAVLDGVVLETSTTKSKKYRGYGNAVLIDHGNGIAAMYAHCQSVGVKAGQRVKQGDVVGSVGNTGRTTTHHIHFEVRKDGKPVDPIPYLTPR
jgi:murein DD-endopeptidase MepM/ murein hydrolase activator NlpD